MGAKSKAVVKTQYIYVNSVNRAGTSTAFNLRLNVPQGIFACDDPSQSFRLSVQDFNMSASWYFVNNTNNEFQVFYTGASPITITIPIGNYSFKALASAVQTQIQASTLFGAANTTVAWDMKTNKMVFSFNDPSATVPAYRLIFNARTNSAHDILGFDRTIYEPNITTKSITSTYTLKSTLSKNITLWIENMTPDKSNQSVENRSNEVCEPTSCLLNIINNYAPFDTIAYVNNTGELYSLHIKEKSIDTLHFTLKDENGALMTYITDWRASIKVETLQDDDAYDTQNQMVRRLEGIEEFVRYIFLQKGLQK